MVFYPNVHPSATYIYHLAAHEKLINRTSCINECHNTDRTGKWETLRLSFLSIRHDFIAPKEIFFLNNTPFLTAFHISSNNPKRIYTTVCILKNIRLSKNSNVEYW